MHFDVDKVTIFLAVSGSHAYGMSTPDSDIDLRGVCLAPIEVRLSYLKKFDQYQGTPGPYLCDRVRSLFRKPNEDFADSTIYDLAKAIKLIADNNPNMLELLWMPEDKIVVNSPTWKAFVEIRTQFLSQKCKYTFMGYAHAQYRKISSHRAWLLNPLKNKPERSDFGLPEFSLLSADDRNRIEEAVTGIVRSWQIEDLLVGAEQDTLRERMHEFWTTTLQCSRENMDDSMKTLAGSSGGLKDETLMLLSAERRYRGALKHWNSYLKWKSDRNPKRAELEARFGFDTKHACHLLRLSRMCVEILRDGVVNVFRPDAEELLAVKNGARSFEDIEEEFQTLERLVESLIKTTQLPHAPDHALIDRTLIETLRRGL